MGSRHRTPSANEVETPDSAGGLYWLCRSVQGTETKRGICKIVRGRMKLTLAWSLTPVTGWIGCNPLSRVTSSVERTEGTQVLNIDSCSCYE